MIAKRANLYLLFTSYCLLFSVMFALPAFANDVDFNALERSENNQWALADYGIVLPSRPNVRIKTLGGRSILEIGETRCDTLEIVFRQSAKVYSVSLEVSNRHLRSYQASAFTATDSDSVDTSLFWPDGNSSVWQRIVTHTLTSTEESNPIVKVILTPPGGSTLGCFDQAAIVGLHYEALGESTPVEAQFRSYPSRLSPRALHQWYNRSTNDNYITTNPAWRGREGLTREGYVWVGIMGYALSPRGGQLAGTVPLHTWHSELYNDHRTTTDPRWIPANARDNMRAGGYEHKRLEGYIFDSNQALAGTWPLQLHYSSSRQEFDTTTRISMLSRIGARNDSYRNWGTQGYVLAAKAGDPQPGRDSSLGNSKSRRDDGTIGELRGSRNILFIGQNYANAQLQNNRAYYSNLLSNNSQWNVRDYFSQISGNRYGINNLGWAATVTMRDNTDTLYDESNINCMAWVPNEEGDQMPNGGIYTLATYRANVCADFVHQREDNRAAEARKVRWMIKNALQLADESYNFAQHDGGNGGNRDNRIDTKELIIVIVMAVPPEGSDRSNYPAIVQQYGGLNRNAACFQADGIQLCNDVLIVDDGVNLATLAHEIMHSVDNGQPDQDIYGGNQSVQMSLKSATVGNTFNEQVSYTLDPWHRMRLGWVVPDIQPISDQVPPSSATLPDDGHAPIFFISPENRTREYFIAEHRIQSRYHTAKLANTQGIHVWYANLPRGNGATVRPAEFPSETNWACDAANRRWANQTSRPGEPVSGPTGASLWTIGFEDRNISQCFRNRRGGWWTPLTKQRGEKELLWYPSNPRFGARIPASEPSGLRLSAGELRDGTIDLEWSAGNMPFKPLITSWSTDGDTWILQGNFGHPENRKAWLTNPAGDRQELEIATDEWTAERVVLKSIPTIEPGIYRVQIENTEASTSGNELHRLAVY